MELRPQDPIPQWITHVAVLNEQRVSTMPSAEYSPGSHAIVAPYQSDKTNSSTKNTAPILADLLNVRVAYGEREVGLGVSKGRI